MQTLSMLRCAKMRQKRPRRGVKKTCRAEEGKASAARQNGRAADQGKLLHHRTERLGIAIENHAAGPALAALPGAQQGRGQGRIAIDGVHEDGHVQAGRIAEQGGIGIEAARIDVHAHRHADLLLHALQPRLVQLGRARVLRSTGGLYG